MKYGVPWSKNKLAVQVFFLPNFWMDFNSDKKNRISNKQPVPLKKALCQLTVCFKFQSRSERRKEHKRCALQVIFRGKVPS